jgi:hypothetical protein
MITLRYRTLVAFLAGVTLTVVAGFAFQAWRADAVGSDETTFVPITPCRLIDTRPAPNRVGPHGAFGVNDTKTIQARGANGNCTITNTAVGLSLNVTAVGATAPTFLTIWPNGSRPEASSLNPFPDQPPTPNAVNTNLAPTGAFNIYNLAGAVNVIVDVNGYYTHTGLFELQSRLDNQLSRMDALALRHAKVDADSGTASLIRGRGISSVRWVSTGVYQVDFDDLDGIAAPGEISVELAAVTDPDTLWVSTFDSTGKYADASDADGFTLFVIC